MFDAILSSLVIFNRTYIICYFGLNVNLYFLLKLSLILVLLPIAILLLLLPICMSLALKIFVSLLGEIFFIKLLIVLDVCFKLSKSSFVIKIISSSEEPNK